MQTQHLPTVIWAGRLASSHPDILTKSSVHQAGDPRQNIIRIKFNFLRWLLVGIEYYDKIIRMPLKKSWSSISIKTTACFFRCGHKIYDGMQKRFVAGQTDKKNVIFCTFFAYFAVTCSRVLRHCFKNNLLWILKRFLWI